MSAANDVDVDFESALLEEIALEGLDGITLNALWVRVKDRPRFPFALGENTYRFLWETAALMNAVSIYKLPTPRHPLVSVKRVSSNDLDSNVAEEPVIEEIYPICPVKGEAVRGSCSTYYTRVDITSEIKTKDRDLLMTYDQVVDKFGESLVLVASQNARNVALLGRVWDDSVELHDIQYLWLERIGRSRYAGEISGSKTGIAALNVPTEDLQDYSKMLLYKRLIKKQRYYVGGGSTTVMFHLARFYVEFPSVAYQTLRKTIEILETKPNRTEIYATFLEEIGVSVNLFEKIQVPSILEIDLVSLRSVCPDLPEESYVSSELVQAIKLVDGVTLKDLDGSEEEDDDDDDDDNQRLTYEGGMVALNKTILSQALYAIESQGPEGLTLDELSREMSLSLNDVRLLCRNLCRQNLVSQVMVDIKTQRISRYISKRHEDAFEKTLCQSSDPGVKSIKQEMDLDDEFPEEMKVRE